MKSHSVLNRLLTAGWRQHCRKLSQTAGAKDVVIVSAVRTPFGSFEGQLAPLSTPQLGSLAIKASVERAGIPKEDVQETYMGNAIQTGMMHAPARQAHLLAGLPEGSDATTFNKACASGLKAIMCAAQSLMVGSQEVMVAGGMDSMSNVPYFVKRHGLSLGDATLYDCLFHDGLSCPWDPKSKMGHHAEHVNRTSGITRKDQDEFCIESYKRAQAAWASGVYKDEVIPVEVKTKKGTITISQDEEPSKFKPDKVPNLKPIFLKDGSVTAANASKNADGGCALVLMTSETAERYNAKPLAKIVSFADACLAPIDFPKTPIKSIGVLLDKTGVKKDDVDLWEVNEAFSTVVVLTMREMGLDYSKVNIHGGAVSLGHPVGASGPRLVAHLVHNLKPGQIGVASICNGGGGASSIMVEGL